LSITPGFFAISFRWKQVYAQPFPRSTACQVIPQHWSKTAARTIDAELGTAVSQRPRETRTWQRLAGRTALVVGAARGLGEANRQAVSRRRGLGSCWRCSRHRGRAGGQGPRRQRRVRAPRRALRTRLDSGPPGSRTVIRHAGNPPTPTPPRCCPSRSSPICRFADYRSTVEINLAGVFSRHSLRALSR